MSAFFEYLRHIIYYLLFASLAGMAAPAGKYRQYVRLVTGLVLLLLVIRPLARFSDGLGVPVTEWFAAAPAPRADYDGMYTSVLRGALDEQLQSQLADLLAREGYTLRRAVFTYTEDLRGITGLTADVYGPPTQAHPPARAERPFIYIEPVRVGLGGDGADLGGEIKNNIARFYGLPAAHIHVNVMKAQE